MGVNDRCNFSSSSYPEPKSYHGLLTKTLDVRQSLSLLLTQEKNLRQIQERNGFAVGFFSSFWSNADEIRSRGFKEAFLIHSSVVSIAFIDICVYI